MRSICSGNPFSRTLRGSFFGKSNSSKKELLRFQEILFFRPQRMGCGEKGGGEGRKITEESIFWSATEICRARRGEEQKYTRSLQWLSSYYSHTLKQVCSEYSEAPFMHFLIARLFHSYVIIVKSRCIPIYFNCSVNSTRSIYVVSLCLKFRNYQYGLLQSL